MQQGPTISTAAGATAAAAAAAATAESGSSGTRKDGGSELLVVDAVSMIRTRRLNQREHTDDEIRAWIEAYTATPTTTSSAAGTAGGPVAVVGAVGVPEYQMAAWLMAVCLHGLSARETAVLTRCMVDSGVRLQWDNHNNDCNCSSSDSSGIIHPQHPRLPLVDKHSTGGVGDKVSLILAPLTASFGGVNVPMMAGRGLGHTGGTIDKLESIPNLRCDWSVGDFQRLCRQVGCVIGAATPELCPADHKLYALRDVTDTVSSLPLQTASIMSKKIAEHPDSLVLDVKYGLGSFQSTVEQAEALAVSMVDTGEVHGLHPVTAFLVRMDEPLGHAVGNWLEVQECIHVLNGTFTALNQDLVRLTVVLAAQMLYQAGRFPNETMEELAQKALAALKNGRALAKFREMVMAQGGDCSVMDDPGSYPFVAAHRQTVRAAKDGYVAAVDALVVGQVSVLLGAGRKTKGDPIDPCAGILVFVKVGQQISKGAIVAELYTNTSETVLQTATARIVDCIQYSDHPVTVPPIVSHRVTKERGTEAFTMPALDW